MAKKQVAVSLRKPPSPEAIAAFVQGEGDANAVSEVASAPKRSRRAKPDVTPVPDGVTPVPESAVAVRDAARENERESAPPAADPVPIVAAVGPTGATLRPVTVYLSPELSERLTLHCIQNDRDLSNVIGEALTNHLSPRLGAGPSDGPAKPESAEAPRGGPGSSWSRGEKTSPRFEWPPRKIEQLVEMGRVLFEVLRRRGYAAG